MRLILSSIATATFALVASAATNVIYPVGVKALPARFQMYLVSEDPLTNGTRLLVGGCSLQSKDYESKQNPSIPGVFIGSGDRIALDRTVHTNPDPNSTVDPALKGDFNFMFFPFVSQTRFISDDRRAGYELLVPTFGQAYHAVIGPWVQDSDGIVRILGSDGEVEKNKLKLCELDEFWWDDAPYLGCPLVKLRIVAI